MRGLRVWLLNAQDEDEKIGACIIYMAARSVSVDISYFEMSHIDEVPFLLHSLPECAQLSCSEVNQSIAYFKIVW